MKNPKAFIQDTVSGIKDTVSEYKGTAREAHENLEYSKLVDKYGEKGAKTIIKPHLEAKGLTMRKFENYR